MIGVTLAAGVITWAMSPIKFQADMGLMLTFMFFWNMIGALLLLFLLASPYLLRTIGAARWTRILIVLLPVCGFLLLTTTVALRTSRSPTRR